MSAFRLVLPLILTFLAAPAPGAEFAFLLGSTHRETALSYSYERDEQSVDGGTLVTSARHTYFIELNSPYYFLTVDPKYPKSRGGMYVMAGISNFSMSQQEVGAEAFPQDLGTRARGRYAYVTPIFFGYWGAHPGSRRGLSFLMGMGLGVGYLRTQGSLRLTEDGSDRLVYFNKNQLAFALSFLIELSHGPWLLRQTMGGPFVGLGEGTLSLDERRTDIGYRFHFRL